MSSANAVATEAEPARPSRRLIALALTIAVATFMQMLDSTVIAVALPGMAHGFGVTPQELGLGITAYVLAAAIVIPVGPWLADRFGARRLFMLALIGFVVASVLCGMSRSLETFVAARFLQGMMAALMGPIGQLILVRSVERRDLLRVMTIASAPMLVATVIGPPLGGFITTFLGWPWIFYLNIPIGLGGAIAAYFLLPNPRGERRPFDVPGLILTILALGPIIYGLGEVGGQQISRGLSALFVVGGAIMGLLALRHFRRTEHPLISLAPVSNRTFRLVTLRGGPLVRVPVVTLPFILPILLQVGFGYSAFLSGLLFLGHTSGDLAMKPFVSKLFRRFGHRRLQLATAAGMCLSIGGCAAFTSATPLWLIALLLFASGCFRSFLMTANSSLAFSEMPPADMAGATTILQASMQLSQAISISLAISILDISAFSRGALSVGPMDCRIALILVSAIGLSSLIAFARLPDNAGAEQSGYRPRRAV